jgi:hypothetical protein
MPVSSAILAPPQCSLRGPVYDSRRRIVVTHTGIHLQICRLRQKARRCSFQKFFEKLLKLIICTVQLIKEHSVQNFTSNFFFRNIFENI